MKRSVSSEVVSRNKIEARSAVAKLYYTIDRRRSKRGPVVPPRPAAVVTAKHPPGPGQNPQQRNKQPKAKSKGRPIDVVQSLPTAGTAQGTVHQAGDATPWGVYGSKRRASAQLSPRSPGPTKEQPHNSKTFTIIDAKEGRVDYESTNSFLNSSSQSNKSPSDSATTKPTPRALYMSSGVKPSPKLKHLPSNSLVQQGSSSVPTPVRARRDLAQRPLPKRPGPVRPPLPTTPHNKTYSAPHSMRIKHRSPSPEYSYIDLGTEPRKRCPSPEYSYVDPENVSALAKLKHGRKSEVYSTLDKSTRDECDQEYDYMLGGQAGSPDLEDEYIYAEPSEPYYVNNDLYPPGSTGPNIYAGLSSTTLDEDSVYQPPCVKHDSSDHDSGRLYMDVLPATCT